MEEGWILVTVEDDGVGFDQAMIKQQVLSGERDSTGIENLIFRFEHLMEARVDITSQPSKGTKVVIRIPVPVGTG